MTHSDTLPVAKVADRLGSVAPSHQQADMVVIFRNRATRSRSLAFGILVIIFLLLVGGATAFVLAPQITLADLSSSIDLDKKITEIQEESEQVSKIMKKQEDELNGWISRAKAQSKNLYANYVQIFTRLGKPVPTNDGNRSNDRLPENLIISDENIFDKEKIYKILDSIPADNQTFRVKIDNPPGVPAVFFDVPRDQAKSIKSDIEGLAIASLPERPVGDNAIRERAKLLDEAIRFLQAKKTERGLEALIGLKSGSGTPESSQREQNTRTNPEVPVAQLIQTNVTRFGTIIMITFLVSILTPLYRYNIRLATYYDARADVLSLVQFKIGSVGFVHLAVALTPTFDFGKAPSTPVEQLIELIQQVRNEKNNAKE